MINNLKTYLLENAYRHLIKPFLFRLNPENVHDRFINIGKLLGKSQITKTITRQIFHYQHPNLEQKIFSLKFPNPIGLSAGFDKNADLINIIDDVGFGFAQIGTVTLNSYQGNPKPRLYRLPKSKALVVYYGLKNIGVKKIIQKFKKNSKNKIPIGISIGKTNANYTANTENGTKDYYQCFTQLSKNKIGDFYTINISCPNTFGGEPFTTPQKLNTLLTKIYTHKTNKPIFLKMPINLKWPKFKLLLEEATKHGINGVIIGNLNKNHQNPAIKDKIPPHIKGGISGIPTQKLSNELISKTYQHYQNKLTIIGVGGIFSAEDAYEKIKRGASLVQLITGMIYQGPQLIGQINQRLVELLKQDSYTNISQAIGSYHKK